MSFIPVQTVLVLGGGSAGFLAALALKVKLPALRVTVVRSRDLGIIGVGEGSTIPLTRFLHDYVGIAPKKFHEMAQPTWKLGLKFVHWGPRPFFFYTFGAAQPDARLPGLAKSIGHYLDETPGDGAAVYDLHGALMLRDAVFERAAAGGGPVIQESIAYHFENEKFVRFLEDYATAVGVSVVDDTVAEVKQDEAGLSALVMKSGRTESADLYVDCSGFVSLLLGKALGEPFTGFERSLFCNRAIVGGWDREPADPIRPYTTCETMDSGWCWQIEHEHRVNRGYVYSSAFISDEHAEQEFRQKNPNVGPTRVVRFVSGCYRRAWVKNVVAIGNAGGFVEPLEATALGVIAMQSRLLADTLLDGDCVPRSTQAAEYNIYHARTWEQIRAFLAMHYKFNSARNTPFWDHCHGATDLAGAARIVEYYRENGPGNLWAPTMFDAFEAFGTAGYTALLLGQKVPFQRTYSPTQRELALWAERRRKWDDAARKAMTVKEALTAIRSPKWRWAASHPQHVM